MKLFGGTEIGRKFLLATDVKWKYSFYGNLTSDSSRKKNFEIIKRSTGVFGKLNSGFGWDLIFSNNLLLPADLPWQMVSWKINSNKEQFERKVSSDQSKIVHHRSSYREREVYVDGKFYFTSWWKITTSTITVPIILSLKKEKDAQ